MNRNNLECPVNSVEFSPIFLTYFKTSMVSGMIDYDYKQSVCAFVGTVMLLTSLLIFDDSEYCATSCFVQPIHWIQLFVSVEVAACLIFLSVYFG